MATGGDGWSVGEDGMFMHYSNGKWEEINTPEGITGGLQLSDVDMISRSEGWAVGNEYPGAISFLPHYANGKWTSTQSPVSETLAAINMVAPEDGWAVGGNGTILHYTGDRWEQVASPTTSHLSDVDMVSEGRGVGYWGRCQ